MSAGGIVTTLGVYLGALLLIGWLANRGASRTPDEYFLAGRKLGLIVLFMALFGTNATAFVLIGVPGLAYHDGIGVFSANAPIVALCTPLSFVLIGVPARRMAIRLGACTPAELYSRRFASPLLGVLLFLAFTIYTVPYMVSAVVGASLTLESMSGGAIPPWAGGLAVVGVAVVYTSLGGMRATAWTNVFQGVLFLGFLLLAFLLISSDLGGLGQAMRSVLEKDGSLLALEREGSFAFRPWLSWSLVISLTVIAFPHMFVRLMSARDESSIKGVCRLYPIGLLALWLPPVLIGVWGASEFPGLVGKESDQIFLSMIDAHLPSALGVLGMIAVLAAVMSSLDAMLLTLSSMLVRDVLDPLRGRPEADVAWARWFCVAISVVVYTLALWRPASIFDIAKVAFSGYVTLTPLLFLGVNWRRMTRQGAIASVVIGNLVLVAGLAGWIPTAGFLPVFWALLAALLAALAVSAVTEPGSIPA